MATWKKLVVSGSSNQQLANDAGYITSADLQNSYATASINGVELIASSPTSSFTFNTASGEASINLVGTAGTDTIEISLVDGGIGNAKLENSSVYISGSTNGAISTIGSVALGDSGSIAVQYDDLTIGVDGSNQLEVKDDSLLVSKLSASAVVTSTEVISDATSGSDDSVATTKAIVDFVNSQIGSSNDLTVGANTGQESIDLTNDQLRVTSSTDASITTSITKADNTGSLVLSLNTASSHFTDGIRDKFSAVDTTGAAGIDMSYDSTNGQFSGSLATSSITFGTDEVFLGDTVTRLNITDASGSFSGSFEGDGSNLTGIATTLSIGAETGTDGSVDLQTQVLAISGTLNEVNTSVSGSLITVGLTDDVTITQDLTVGRNLTVFGTASFQHTEDYDVADRFIRLASGSTAAGDGGIVIQQTGPAQGEVFAFHAEAGSNQGRWGLSGSFDASQNTFQPDAFMAAVVGTEANGNDPNGTDAPAARYNLKGNIFVAQDSEDIWIYS